MSLEDKFNSLIRLEILACASLFVSTPVLLSKDDKFGTYLPYNTIPID